MFTLKLTSCHKKRVNNKLTPTFQCLCILLYMCLYACSNTFVIYDIVVHAIEQKNLDNLCEYKVLEPVSGYILAFAFRISRLKAGPFQLELMLNAPQTARNR